MVTIKIIIRRERERERERELATARVTKSPTPSNNLSTVKECWTEKSARGREREGGGERRRKKEREGANNILARQPNPRYPFQRQMLTDLDQKRERERERETEVMRLGRSSRRPVTLANSRSRSCGKMRRRGQLAVKRCFHLTFNPKNSPNPPSPRPQLTVDNVKQPFCQKDEPSFLNGEK